MSFKIEANSVDLYRVNWKTVLESNAYREVAKELANVNASDIHYNSKLKTISYGPHILNLNEMASTDSNIELKDRVSYTDQIDHLAKLIEEKLQLDKIIKPNNEIVIPILEAVRFGDLAKVNTLIQEGVDIDIKDDQGKSPLWEALRLGRHEIFLLLVKGGADLNQKDGYGYTPLIWAIASDQPLIFQELICAKADLNLADGTGFIPLTWALNKLDYLKKLLEAGADVNLPSNDRLTPLKRAFLKENLPAVQMLISNGALVDRALVLKAFSDGNKIMFCELIKGKEREKFSILDDIKRDRPANYRYLVDLIHKTNPELKMRSKEVRYRLNLSHAWSLSGTTRLSPDFSIDLEGAFSSFWYVQMKKNLKSFEKTYPKALIPKVLESTLENAAIKKGFTNNELLRRIKNGLPTFFQSGYQGHSVTILIWKDQFVICNRGESSRLPIEVYHFDPKALNEGVLGRIREKGTKNEYKELVSRDLPKKLHFYHKDLDAKIEEHSQHLSPQAKGNCSFLSPVTGVYAFLMLASIRGEKNGQLLDEVPENYKKILQYEQAVYKTWFVFEQISSLEQMLKLLGTSNFMPDHVLIQRALHEAYFLALDPQTRLGKKLIALTDAYITNLNQVDAIELKTNIEFWKMEAQQ